MAVINDKQNLTNDNTTKESAVESKKVKNKKRILKCLYFENKKSISELATALFISIPTLTSYIEELNEEGWIVGEEMETRKQGRNPTIYSLNPGGKLIAVFDVTTHSTRVAIINLRNEILWEDSYEVGVTTKESTRDSILGIIENSLAKITTDKGEIIGIGLTSPGLVNELTGQNKTYPNLNVDGLSLRDIITQQWNIPCFILNDTKATVLGESIFGGSKGENHLLSVNVDWGVGLAVVIDGQIFSGASGFAGELGHVQVKPDGDLCKCGKIGCLDTVASASALLYEVRKGLKAGTTSALSKFKENPEQVNLENVIDAANNGDSFAIDTLYKIGVELGKGLSVAVHLYNPQLIVIDGVLSKAGNLIVNPIEFAINKFCLPDFKEKLTIRVTDLGDRAKILGMNAYVTKRIFSNE